MKHMFHFSVAHTSYWTWMLNITSTAFFTRLTYLVSIGLHNCILEDEDIVHTSLMSVKTIDVSYNGLTVRGISSFLGICQRINISQLAGKQQIVRNNTSTINGITNNLLLIKGLE